LTQAKQGWDEFIHHHPGSHILQTNEWGELKSEFGWQPIRIIVQGNNSEEIGAQILFRQIPFGLSIGYIPKGPVFSNQISLDSPTWTLFWEQVNALCKEKRCVFLKVEPDVWEGSSTSMSTPTLRQYWKAHGFVPGKQDIQPRRTMIVDLNFDEDAILGKMKQKTRYNIRLSEKKGVQVEFSRDLETFHQLMTITSQRDHFGIHPLPYYQSAYNKLNPSGHCELFMAHHAGKPLAGLMAFSLGKRAWYFYGASSEEMRELMPTYLLQWKAIRWAMSKHCTEYDLWGVPDADLDQLEQQFTSRSDELWGVYRFKRGFGGILKRSIGSWDKIYYPTLYRIYLIMLRKRPSFLG
jgi:lipid II:glycine glycyltransferase (peptidoglycan interpeptide bridge formation enzyme)